MRIVAVMMLLSTVACASRSSNDSNESARAVAQRFCELDARGLALSSTTWPQMSALTEEGGQYENEETARVIADFQVVRTRRDGSSVLVTVRFAVLAEMHFPEMNLKREDIEWTFHVIKVKSEWRIATGPFGDYMPRVAYVRPLVLAQHLESIVTSPGAIESDETREQDDRYRGYIGQLRALAANAGKQPAPKR